MYEISFYNSDDYRYEYESYEIKLLAQLRLKDLLFGPEADYTHNLSFSWVRRIPLDIDTFVASHWTSIRF